jgi:DNA-binding winged helix-turn-helix (wHTH) protein
MPAMHTASCPHCGGPLAPDPSSAPFLDHLHAVRSGSDTRRVSGSRWLILMLLRRHEGRLVSYDALLTEMARASFAAPDRNLLGVQLHRLRRDLAGSGYTIVTVRGEGVVLEAQRQPRRAMADRDAARPHA